MKQRTMKEVLKGSAIALLSAVLVASVAAACTSIASPTEAPSSQIHHHQHDQEFGDPADAGPSLPGVQRYLWYTAHNPLKVPITVRSLSISTVTPPSRLPDVEPGLRRNDVFRLSGGPGPGSNSVPVPISLFETH